MHGEVIPEFAAYVAALGTDHEPARAAEAEAGRPHLRRRTARGRDLGAGRMTTPMTSHVEIRTGAFADSVTLLQVSRAVQGLPGVAAAQVAMATALNLEVLAGMGFDIPAEATTNDMVVALRLDAPDALDAALAGVAQALADATRRTTGAAEQEPSRTTGSALREAGDGAVALISVPGASALPRRWTPSTRAAT